MVSILWLLGLVLPNHNKISLLRYRGPNHLFDICGYENEVDATESELCHAEEHIDETLHCGRQPSELHGARREAQLHGASKIRRGGQLHPPLHLF